MKKILLSFLIFLVTFTSFAPNFIIARAQEDPEVEGGTTPSLDTETTWYNPGPLEFYTKVFDKNSNDIFGERYTYAQVKWIGYSLLAILVGGDFGEALKVIEQTETQDNATGLNNLKDVKTGGVAEGVLNLINVIYSSPPASGRYWLSEKIEDFSIVKTANAQEGGFGYNSLGIFLPLWKASRNIAYIIMVIIIFTIAFAVMFRVKVNPQLMVTIQSSIPKIISTLVLITFSYAIVGFLIDLMYLIFGAIVYGLGNAGAFDATTLTSQGLFDEFLNGNILAKPFNAISISVIIIYLIVGIGLSIASVGTLVPFFVGILIAVIVFFVKAFLMLAQTYLSLVINIVFAPIIILSEAIPFVKASAIGWFRSVIADILIFMAVGALFFLQEVLINIFQVTTTSWAPPYLGFHPTVFSLLVWLGVWAMIPNIRKSVYEMMEKRAADIQTPREFSGVGESFSRGFSQYNQNADFTGSLKTGLSKVGRWITGGRGTGA